MRKNVYGRKFKRDKDERKALFKTLLTSLVLNGRIKTTTQKAKAIKPDADKLITKARKESILAKRLLERDLLPSAIEKLMKEIAPRFANRKGGYTRIIKLGNRFSDNASTAILEWVEMEEIVTPVKEVKEPKAIKATIKKVSKAKTVKKVEKPVKKTVKKGAKS
jgi:large subunit ribosomal protein L17